MPQEELLKVSSEDEWLMPPGRVIACVSDVCVRVPGCYLCNVRGGHLELSRRDAEEHESVRQVECPTAPKGGRVRRIAYRAAARIVSARGLEGGMPRLGCRRAVLLM